MDSGGLNKENSGSLRSNSSILACQEVHKMSLAINELRKFSIYSNSITTSKHAPQVERNG